MVSKIKSGKNYSKRAWKAFVSGLLAYIIHLHYQIHITHPICSKECAYALQKPCTILYNDTQHHVCIRSLGICIDGPVSIINKQIRKLPFLNDKLTGVVVEDIRGTLYNVQGHLESMCVLNLELDGFFD